MRTFETSGTISWKNAQEFALIAGLFRDNDIQVGGPDKGDARNEEERSSEQHAQVDRAAAARVSPASGFQTYTEERIHRERAEARIAALESALRRAAIVAFTAGYRRGHQDTVEGGYTDVRQSDEATYFADEVDALLKEDAAIAGSPALTVSDNDGQPCVVQLSPEFVADALQGVRAARTAKLSRDEAYAALYRVLIDTTNIHPTTRAYMLADAVLALQPNAPVDRSGEHPADSHAAATCGGSVADSPLVGAASVSGPIRKVEAGGDSTSPSVSATALLKHGAPGGAVGVASQESADRVVRSGPPVPTTPPRAEEWPTTPGAFKPHEMPPTVDVMRASTVCAMIEEYRTALDEARAELERLRAENRKLSERIDVYLDEHKELKAERDALNLENLALRDGVSGDTEASHGS